MSFFDTRPGTNQRIAEVRVGTEPNSVALCPDGTRAYVANTVSVMNLDRFVPAFGTIVATIPVGTEPLIPFAASHWGMVKQASKVPAFPD